MKISIGDLTTTPHGRAVVEGFLLPLGGLIGPGFGKLPWPTSMLMLEDGKDGKR